MRILFLSVLACLALHFPGHSQSLKQVLEAGDESFQNRDYYNAYRCYETILKYADEGAYKGNTLKVKFSYAQAAQRLNYFSRAKALYGEVSREARGVDGDIYARSVFNQAKMYQNLAQDTTRYYGLALDTYQLFLSDELYQKIEGGPEIQSRFRRAAESGIQSCDAMRAALPSRTDSLYRLTGAVNSGYSELAPVLMGDTLYFSSIRFLPKGIRNPLQPQFYSKNLTAKFTQVYDPERAVEVTDTIVDELPEQSIYNADGVHTLHTAFNLKRNLMFFTRCVQEDGEIFCWLYQRRRQSDGSWGVPQKLPLSAENKEFSTTQPSVAYDCTSNTEWLYFTSDRKGSVGGYDIWRARLNDDETIGEPENLSDINTPWNEATPFYHAPSQRLYFSSDAPPSYGEYDIFYSRYQDGSWQTPENMGFPYNSGYNDEYFFLSADGKYEYFASDRPRSFRFVEELEFCCTDIYTMANEVDRVLEVALEDCDNKYGTEKTVAVYELSCEEPQLVGEPQKVVGKGTATFTLQLYHNYKVVAYSESTGISREKQFDLSGEQYISREDRINWRPEPFFPNWLDMKVTAFDSSDSTNLDAVASVTVREAATGRQPAGSGNHVYRIEPNRNYLISVVVNAGADYGVEQANTGQPSSTTITQNYIPVDTTYSFTLSDEDKLLRLCGEVELRVPMKVQPPTLDLPIFLYFDHDMPLRYQGQADQTRQTFDDAITRYLDKRKDYLANNDPSEQRRVDAFFDREVMAGLSTLENLAKSLLEYVNYMKEGEQLVIEIQGYCSPRGKPVYNQLLSERRIQCVRTYLENYSGQEGRVLKDYIGDKIIVKELPLGESRASSNYPDNDPNSIWGIGPALDRRVEIQNLSTGEPLTNTDRTTGEEMTSKQRP
ncbi:MAG: PD40 domain-containing protein [Phaeodactylibacter sp.]|nr:PD40 domain-containing protein [Phaeodactylibacter sp.]MCB9266266.1 PD40 domain-containing protein [Lewinellaceae bacterium]